MVSTIYTDGQYAKRHPTWHDEDAEDKAGIVLAVLKYSGLRPASICDIGCGTGGVLQALARELPAVRSLLGYDVSPWAVSIAERRSDHRLSFFLGSMPEPGTGRCDLALCLDVIEHVDDYRGFLSELGMVANYHIFNVPLALNAWSAARGFPLVDSRANDGHIHYFTKDLFFAALAETGLSVVLWSYHRPTAMQSLAYRRRVTRMIRTALYRMSPDVAVRLVGGWSLAVLAVRAEDTEMAWTPSSTAKLATP